MPEAHIEAVRAAIRERRLNFEIHTSPSTKLGKFENDQATILRTVVDTEKARGQLGALRRQFAEVREADTFTEAGRKQFDQDVDAIERLETRLKRAYDRDPLDPAEVRTVLTAILEGSSRVESVAAIATRNEIQLRDRRLGVQRVQLETDTGGADEPYMDAAKESRKQRKLAARAAAQAVVPMALADPGSRPLAKASIAPPDLTVVKNPATKQTTAITPPGADASASDQVVKLLREGVPLASGKTRKLDRVILDTAGADLRAVAAVLAQVRKSLGPRPDDASRFRVTIDATVTASEETLRKALGLSKGVHFQQVTRTPPGTPTWMVSFDPEWVPKTK